MTGRLSNFLLMTDAAMGDSNGGPKYYLLLLILLCSGCFVGTPKEELSRLNAEIVPRAGGGVRVSLANTRANDSTLEFVTALCGNHPEYDYIAELDLADTSVTDRGLCLCKVCCTRAANESA